MENRPGIHITRNYGNNGDNHNDDFPGANIGFEEFAQQNGLISEAAVQAMQNRNSSGVLQTAMRSITEDKDYRQELKTAYWKSPEEARRWVLAKEERERFGVSIRPLVDDLIARKAGVKGSFLHELFTALTHTSFSTNYTGNLNKKNKWFSWANNNGNNRDSDHIGQS